MFQTEFAQCDSVYALPPRSGTGWPVQPGAIVALAQSFIRDTRLPDITILAPGAFREPHHGDGAWTTLTVNGVVVRVAWYDRVTTDPLIGGDNIPAGRQALRLSTWHRIIGTPYYGSPGVAATMHLRSTRFRGRQGVQWKIRESGVITTWTPPAQINGLSWHRELKGSAKLANACQWDLRAAFLAAVSMAYLPGGYLQPTGANPIMPADGGTGYYRVRLAKADPWRRWLGPADRHGCHWLGPTTYQVLGCPPVLDSLTAPGRRILRGWAEKWRDILLTCTTEPYRSVLKDGYTQAIGLMAVPSGSIYRPDWRHMFVDYTQGSMLRRIKKVHGLHAGLLPSCVDVDSVWYHHPPELAHHTLAASLEAGNRIGQFRQETQPCLGPVD